MGMGRADNVTSSIGVLLFATARRLGMPIDTVFKEASKLIYSAMNYLCHQSELWRFEGSEEQRNSFTEWFFDQSDFERSMRAKQLLQIADRRCARFLTWDGQEVRTAAEADEIFDPRRLTGVAIVDAAAIANQVRHYKSTPLFTMSNRE